jgi:hypothetical protein
MPDDDSEYWYIGSLGILPLTGISKADREKFVQACIRAQAEKWQIDPDMLFGVVVKYEGELVAQISFRLNS